MNKFIPNCLATGIGSLPHSSLEEALKLITTSFSTIPHWPQLPKWGEEEGFINQYIEPLVRLGLMEEKEGGLPFFNTQAENWIESITKFYEIYLEAEAGSDEALDFFAFPEKGGAGFYGFMEHLNNQGVGEAKYLKGQISGPLTLALQVTDENKRSAYYNQELRDLLIKTLAMMAKWQARKLKAFGLPVLVFVDDPGLCNYGLSTHITLKKEEIIEELNSIYDGIHEEGCIAGTHSCASIDWTILMESKVDIISFDAYYYFSSIGVYDKEMQSFLKRGGSFAWGIIPTSDDLDKENVNSLKEKLFAQIDYLVNKGLSKDEILEKALITPSCGTGTLSIEQAEKIYSLAKELSERLRG